MNKISTEEYTDAVISCVKMAQTTSGGARRCAEVLLSAYNGNEFHVSIADLSGLDRNHFANVVKVIRGRIELGLEPQDVIENGEKLFMALRKAWYFLEKTERAKNECPTCDGYGSVAVDRRDPDGERNPCKMCSGRGRVCACQH